MMFRFVQRDDVNACTPCSMSRAQSKALSDCRRALANQPVHIRIPLTKQIAGLKRALQQKLPEAAMLARTLINSLDFIETVTRQPIGDAGLKIRALCTGIGVLKVLAPTGPAPHGADGDSYASNDDLAWRTSPAA